MWFLEIEDEVLKGEISDEVKSLDYENLGDLQNCGNGFKFFNLEKDLDIFPNPTTAVVNISNKNISNYSAELTLNIYDVLGRKLQTRFKPDGILFEEYWVIDMHDFPVGLFLFELNGLNQRKTFKVIKQ